MPASTDCPDTPTPRWRTLAAPALLALWLGWTLPALWAQAAGRATPASDWNAGQILAQLPPGLLADSGRQPLLLRSPSSCGCASAPALPAGLSVRAGTPSLPFEWLVLHEQRLVYAGPAVLAPACGGSPLAATHLVTQLLRGAHAPVVLSDHCPCHKE
ncbi:hypothetical protein A9K58_07105 [Stenotrophomonas maltophilia]|uniref:Uncharacterized protein n=1 Tax=Stenotrophomonas maltophilia TaxID=40324 RepID=A0A1A6Y149_STEMA|nr:hypothetical protein [Stenotrophomonas maltophilia]OBU68569.1 hypothetical protein A9K58_07105 [Stenotrophomonas maltophilia]